MVESVETRCVVEDADSAGSVASKSPALFMLRALCQLHRRAPQELVSERCPGARSSQLAVRTGRCVPPPALVALFLPCSLWEGPISSIDGRLFLWNLCASRTFLRVGQLKSVRTRWL